MELTYYQREMRTERDAGDAEQMRADRSKRRQQGRRLGMRCPGNWKRKAIVHWCMGCCQTLADAIGNTLQVAMVVVFSVLPNDAANKWLSVWPLMADTVFMLYFHKVFLEAFRYALGYEVQDDLAAISQVSETELSGAPATGEAWHKLQSRRALKVLAYLEDAINPRLLAIMVDHCVFSDAPALQFVQGCARAPQGYEPNLIFKLVDSAKSCVGNVRVKLTHQIFDSEEWALLQDRHGPIQIMVVGCSGGL